MERFYLTEEVNKKIIDCYEQDYQSLLLSLKEKSLEDRNSLYEEYTKILFPKIKRVVNLEDQLSSRPTLKQRFFDHFIIVCGWMFSTSHLGECCFSLFNKKRSVSYPRKVILSLGMMGYIRGLRVGYSNSGDEHSHGYIYDMDLEKLNGWDMTTTVLVGREYDVDWIDCLGWEKRIQFDTICSMEVLPEWRIQSQSYLNSFNSYISAHTLKDNEIIKRDSLWSISSSLISLDRKETKKIYETLKTDNDYAGRFYSPITNMKGEIRRNALTLEGEHLVEVDVSSAQPTFLGLLLMARYPNHKSVWLEHCLQGDLYEWLMDITQMRSRDDKARRKIKEMTLKYLYSTDPMEREENPKWKSDYKKYFAHRLSLYLYHNDRELYDLIEWFRTNPVVVPRKSPNKHGSKTKKRNNLCLEMTSIEVKYIKECIKHIPKEIKYFYSIHDCLGCKESDSLKLKSIMEQVSREMFGVVIGIKIEKGEISNPQTLIGPFNPKNVIGKVKGKRTTNRNKKK